MIIQFKLKGGKLVSGKEFFEKFFRNSPDGIYTARFSYTGQPKTIAESRRYYFFICDMIAYEGDTGYKSKEIHNLFKEQVLPNIPNISTLVSEPLDYMDFSDPLRPKIKYSTKMLTLDGWHTYIDAIKTYAKEHMDFLI